MKRRNLLKNVKARVMPFTVLMLLLVASFWSIYYVLPGEDKVVSAATSTGWCFPSDHIDTGYDWADINNSYESDDSRTHGSSISNEDMAELRVFSFNIPSDENITGIQVRVEAATEGDAFASLDVKLSGDNGSSYSDTKTEDPWSESSETTKYFGNSSSLWGKTWNSSNFTNQNFTVYLDWSSGSDPGTNFYCDAVSVEVTYGGAESPNNAPTISSPSPSDNETGVSISTYSWNCTIEDPDGDTFNWTICTTPYVGNNTGWADSNGSKNTSLSGLSYGTSYTVYVNVTDGTNSTNDTYTFTTQHRHPPKGEYFPGNGQRNVEINPTLTVSCSDQQGYDMNITFRTNASGSWEDIGSNNSVNNGSYSQTPTNMNSYGTTYYWTVNISNGYNWTNKTLLFTTPAPSEYTLSKYKTITLSNATQGFETELVINFASGPVNLSGNCNGDFSDIRFFSMNYEPLSYWIEEKTDSDNAIVWVKLPDQKPSQIYVAYGNDSLISGSNGKETFQIFTDFYYNDTGEYNNQIEVTDRENATYANSLCYLNSSSYFYLYNITNDMRYRWSVKRVECNFLYNRLTDLQGGDSCTPSLSHSYDCTMTLSQQRGRHLSINHDCSSQGGSMGTWFSTNPFYTFQGELKNSGGTISSHFYDEDRSDTWCVRALLSASTGGCSEATAYCGSGAVIDWMFYANYSSTPPTILSTSAEQTATFPPVSQSLSEEHPAHESTNISPHTILSIDIAEPNGDSMNITFRTNASGSWEDIGTNTSVNNGTYSQLFTEFDYNTTYWWSVNSSNGEVFINETYSFTTLSNSNPSNSMPSPSNTATDQSRNPTLSISVSDPNSDTMNVTFRTNASGSWEDIGSNNSVNNGSYSQTPTNMNSSNTTYWWSVNTTDGYGGGDNDTYYFTTEAEPPNPQINIDKIANISEVGAGNTSAKVNYMIWVNNTGNVDFDWVLINDTKFNCSCHDFYEDAGGWETNASETTGFTLTHDTCWRTFNYTSALNASDSLVFWYNKTIYNCTGVTEGYVTNIANVTVNQSLATDTDMVTIAWGNVDNDPPEITNISPANETTGISISLSALSFDLADPDGNLMNYDITTNISGSWASLQSSDGVSNGTKSASLAALTPLNYSTVYGWNITATDGVESNTTHLSFTTAPADDDGDDGGGGGGGGFIPPTTTEPGDTTPTDTDDTPSTPGFEILILIASVVVCVLLIKRRKH